MDPSGRVDEKDVAFLGLERLDGVEDDGGGVGAVLAFDDGDPEPRPEDDCSWAAARNVSAAAIMTFFPARW